MNKVKSKVRDRVKNPYLKMRPVNKPYEIWENDQPFLLGGYGGDRFEAGTWQWHVLKKWQVDDDKEYARWYCLVKSPMVPEGELGDVYTSDIKSCAKKIFSDGPEKNGS